VDRPSKRPQYAFPNDSDYFGIIKEAQLAGFPVNLHGTTDKTLQYFGPDTDN
jgi:hypothetical protein